MFSPYKYYKRRIPNINDSTLLPKTIENRIINCNTKKYKIHNRYKQYLIADPGYYSKNNFILTGIKELTVTDKNLDATSISDMDLGIEVDSSYFKLISKGRALLEDEEYIIKNNWFDEILDLMKSSNIYCDLSYLSSFKEDYPLYLNQIKRFPHPVHNKIMLGTDWY